MADSFGKKIKNFFKHNFVAGFLLLVPIGATFTLINYIIKKSDEVWRLIPAQLRPETYLGFNIPGLGLILTFLFIVLIGIFGRIYVGKWLIKTAEEFIHKIPLISGVYSGLKQLMDTTFKNEGTEEKRKVVMVEFPRQGMYSIGFVTSTARGETQEKTAKAVVNVFIPTTPNPTSGFFVMLPESELIMLDMSVNDAFKLIVSGGIVTPPLKSSSTNLSVSHD